jgi:hypothetical protein
VEVKKSRSPTKQRKDEGNGDEKLSEMVIFSLHPPKKRKEGKEEGNFY